MAHQPVNWTVVVEDESIFVYETEIRSIWAVKGSKPRVLRTGSHRRTVLFGALAEDGTQLFRQYKNADSDEFLEYLKELQHKYPKMILFIDRATYHKKEARVRKYFRKHRDTIKVRWFPSAFPEANPVEECWHQSKDSLLGSRFHSSFDEFKKTITRHFRTTRFNIDLYKYLCH